MINLQSSKDQRMFRKVFRRISKQALKDRYKKSIILSLIFGMVVPSRPSLLLAKHLAVNNIRQIVIIFLSSISIPFTEGLALATIFLTISTLSNNSALHLIKKINEWINITGISINLNIRLQSVVFVLILSAFIVQIAQSLFKYLNANTIGYFAAKCKVKVTGEVYERIISLDLNLSSDIRTGTYNEVINIGPEAIRSYFEQLNTIAISFLLVIVYSLTLFTVSPQLFACGIGMTAAVSLISKKLVPRITERSIVISSQQQIIISEITEIVKGIRMFKSSGYLKDISEARVFAPLSELEKSLKSQSRHLSIAAPLISVIPMTIICAFSAISVSVYAEDLSLLVPVLATFVICLQRLGAQLALLNDKLNQLSENHGRLLLLDDLLSKHVVAVEQGSKKVIEGPIYLEFKNVSLQLVGNEKPIVEDISFALKPNQRVGIIGPSGSGKSTIIDLISGLKRPTQGNILLNGMDIKQYCTTSWRRKIGIVGQTTFLMNDTVLNNITLGDPHPDLKAVYEAIKESALEAYVKRLPQGIYQFIGEDGVKLSGGQRQRLSIARALYKKPRVLILDEATSSLDSKTEKEIQKSLKGLSYQHSVLSVAHRINTILDYDKIIVLEHGKITAIGTHQELLETSPTYSDMWELQQKDKRYI